MANGTTLGTGYVQIVPSMEGVSSGISKLLNSEGVSAGNEAGVNTGTAFGSSLSSTIKKVVGTLAIGATIKESFNLGADLEQQLGGIDTLFGDSAQKMKDYANEAYNTTGLSANAYMSNVTSFSAALLQGLSQDTEAAAEYANRAMIDMADNANKFGTDISSIQNAYQGFSKQNYTMLDNLKLGYGGTKEEMQRLIKEASTMTDVQEELGVTVDKSSLSFDNIVNAISVVQKNMGVAGTTAEEAATTFSGSFASMRASAQNFLSALMMDGKDGVDVESTLEPLIESISIFVFSNLLPAIQRFIGAVIKSLPSIIKSAIEDVSPQISDALGIAIDPAVVTTALEAIGTAFAVFAAAESFTSIAKKIVQIGSAFSALAANPVVLVVAALAAVGVALVKLYKNNEDFRNKVNVVMGTLIETVSATIEKVLTYINALINNILIPAWEGYIKPLIKQIGTWLQPYISILLGTLQNIIQSAVDIINGIIDVFTGLVTGNFELMGQGLGEIFGGIWNIAITIWTSIGSIIQTTVMTIVSIVSSVFSGLRSTVSSIFSSIAAAMSNPIETAKNKIKTIIDTIKGFFTGFSVTLPHINLPHFSISPAGWQIGDLLSGVIPSLGISWYAKAMDEPYMLSSAHLIGAGEAGDEVVYGHSQLLKDIRDSVISANRLGEGNDMLSNRESNQGYIQTINIYSPTELSPSEVARQTRNQTRQMILAMNRG